jgi:hypothetical protein
MGLLDKTNPNATRASVIREAIYYGVFTAALCLAACYWKPSFRPHWYVLLPVSILFGSAIGALMEWQMDDASDKPKDETWDEAFDD